MLLADRGDDADDVRREIAFTGTRTVIPAKRGRRCPTQPDAPHLAHRIERMFSKFKNWRRITTRHDKIAASCFGFVHGRS